MGELPDNDTYLDGSGRLRCMQLESNECDPWYSRTPEGHLREKPGIACDMPGPLYEDEDGVDRLQLLPRHR